MTGSRAANTTVPAALIVTPPDSVTSPIPTAPSSAPAAVASSTLPVAPSTDSKAVPLPNATGTPSSVESKSVSVQTPSPESKRDSVLSGLKDLNRSLDVKVAEEIAEIFTSVAYFKGAMIAWILAMNQIRDLQERGMNFNEKPGNKSPTQKKADEEEAGRRAVMGFGLLGKKQVQIRGEAKQNTAKLFPPPNPRNSIQFTDDVNQKLMDEYNDLYTLIFSRQALQQQRCTDKIKKVLLKAGLKDEKLMTEYFEYFGLEPILNEKKEPTGNFRLKQTPDENKQRIEGTVNDNKGFIFPLPEEEPQSRSWFPCCR